MPQGSFNIHYDGHQHKRWKEEQSWLMASPTDITPRLRALNKELVQYMVDNKLSFQKDYRDDPVHGPFMYKILTAIAKEKELILDNYPFDEAMYQTKYFASQLKRSVMKKVKKLKKKAEATKAQSQSVEKKKVKKETGTASSRVTKYDYPLIDGREMTAVEKKKYRAKTRNANAKENGESKPKKKVETSEKPAIKKKVIKKVKKVHNDED